MFARNGKRRRHPLFTVTLWGLAMFGAYSVVGGMKCACKNKVESMMSCMKKKPMGKSCCGTDSFCSEDGSEYGGSFEG